jgi:hypothetical protein
VPGWFLLAICTASAWLLWFGIVRYFERRAANGKPVSIRG